MKNSKIYLLILIGVIFFFSTSIYPDSKIQNNDEDNSQIYEMPIIFNYPEIPIITIHQEKQHYGNFFFLVIYPDGKIIWSEELNNKFKISSGKILGLSLRFYFNFYNMSSSLMMQSIGC